MNLHLFPETNLSSSLAVINGEKATLETPTFAQKRQRTLDMLIRSLYQDLMPDLHKVHTFVPALHGSSLPFLDVCICVYILHTAVLHLQLVTSLTGNDCGHRWAAFCCVPLQPSAYCTIPTGYYCNADFLIWALPPHISLVLTYLVFPSFHCCCS